MAIRGGLIASLMLACAPLHAHAQDAVPAGADKAYAEASPSDAPMDADTVSPAQNSAAEKDGQLSLDDPAASDPASFADKPVRTLKLPGYGDAKAFDITPGDGSVTVKTPYLPGVETKAGADMAAPTTSAVPTPWPSQQKYGAAWASIGVPNVATIDGRVDPNTDQRQFGTTLQHSMPLGSKLSVTLQDRWSVTDTFSFPATTDSYSSFYSAMPPSPTQSQAWGNENSVKFDILPTGTSLAAGVTTSSIDPATHNSFSADQKIYGPLHVTTSLNDVGQTTASKSISARVKLNW